ncbi:MAG: Sec-independent protein translocase protein TatB [Pseudomonadota bacterium]
MLDIGFLEIVVIGALALIVVGPKDLPGLLRTVGQFVGKMRTMAREFQSTMDEAAREADLADVADVVKGGGKLKKNAIVDSLKEFEKTVKTEVNDAARAAETTVAAKPDPLAAAKATAAATAAGTANGFKPAKTTAEPTIPKPAVDAPTAAAEPAAPAPADPPAPDAAKSA